MTAQTQKIWIVMGHPLQLPLAMTIAINKPAEIECHLLVSRHKYWKYIDEEEAKKYFSTVRFFEEIPYAHGVKELLRIIRALRKTKRAIKAIPIDPSDIIISVEAWNYVENLVTTVHKDNKQIFLCPEGIYRFISLTPEQIRLDYHGKVTISGWVHRLLVEPLLGLKKRTYDYWNYSLKAGHGVAYTKKVEQLYDRVFILKSVFNPNLQENELHYPYYALRQSSGDHSSGKMAVFFLSGYLKEKKYIDKISAILQNLRLHYEGKYEMHIRVHPGHPDSYVNVDWSGWQINREPGNGEQFLMRHAASIIAAITDKSTGQIFPLNLGIPSYSYFRVLESERQNIDWQNQIYAAAPKEFFLRSLDQIPAYYEPDPNGLEKARNSLDKLFQEILS